MVFVVIRFNGNGDFSGVGLHFPSVENLYYGRFVLGRIDRRDSRPDCADRRIIDTNPDGDIVDLQLIDGGDVRSVFDVNTVSGAGLGINF